MIAILFCSISIGLGLIFIGESLVELILGKSFGESTYVFKAISLTLIPLLPIRVMLGSILIYAGNEVYYLIALIASTITAIISSPILLNAFGVIGGVYSMAASMFICIAVAGYFYFSMNAREKNFYNTKPYKFGELK